MQSRFLSSDGGPPQGTDVQKQAQVMHEIAAIAQAQRPNELKRREVPEVDPVTAFKSANELRRAPPVPAS